MSLNRQYNIIIAGMGAAGWWTAFYLQRYHSNLNVLMVDREIKRDNDRTWCFWGEPDEDLHPYIHHSWSSIVFHSPEATYGGEPDCPAYHMVRSDHFYREMNAIVSQQSNFHFHQGEIQRIGEDEQSAYLLVDNHKVRANLIFDSTFHLQDWVSNQTRPYTFLWQHFLGWRIKTEQPLFNPQEAVLMDFNTAQKDCTRFFYVLPLSENEALIEYTLFSKQLLEKSVYTAALEDYIREELGTHYFTILEEEQGKIPMTDGHFYQPKAPSITSIGIQGGFAKPTTGYAFLKIQSAAKKMVKELDVKSWTVGKLESSSSRFFFYDQLLLHLLAERGELGQSIFCALFKHNSVRRILTFLEERSSLLDEARLFASLPTLPFLKAILPVMKRKYSLLSLEKETGHTSDIKGAMPIT